MTAPEIDAQPEDLAGREYWDSVWEPAELPDPAAMCRVDRRLAELFREVVPPGHGRQMLEVGAARSIWLPWFARELEYRPVGLDYSPVGCEQARQVLAAAGVDGEVVLGDFYSPPEGLLGSFDLVITFGLVEHFSDTAGCIAALGEFLAPGGLMITLIPNMTAATGRLQRWASRPVYDLHVPLDAPALRRAHEAAGLEVDRCAYEVSTHLGVVGLNGIAPESARRKSRALWPLRQLSRAVLFAEDKLGVRLPATRAVAPYAICFARRPSS